MRTFIQFISSVLLLIISTLYSTAQCHLDDWTALKNLFTSTNGNNWLDKTNWDLVLPNSPPPNCDLANLYGIKTNPNGRVQEINLYNNNLSGSLPALIENLTWLERLYLGYDAISGNIPPEIGSLNNLKVLGLSDAELEGTIPTSFENLGNLEILYLFNNNLSGTILPELGNLTELKFLYIQNNQLTGTLPASISNLNNLTRLYIGGNQLIGCYPPEWTVLCNQLTFGYISDGNNLDASWADFCSTNDGICLPNPPFCNLQDWQALKVFYNATNGNSWGIKTNWTQVTSSTPPANCNLHNLHGIQLNDNGRVEQITLFSNNLTGSIPPEIGALSKLKAMYLDYNTIAGTIPVEIENLTQLNTLSLQNNQLTGSIPVEIGNLSNLTILYLNNNLLSGTIPTELGNLNNLQSLFLSNNELNGSIPPSFAQLNNLTNLNISNNQLTGCYDASLAVLCSQLQFSQVSNSNFFDASWADFCAGNIGVCIPDQLLCNLQDWQALKAFYNAANGDNWAIKTNWNIVNSVAPPTNCNLENLHGVQLNNNGRVNQITLFGNNLTGTITPEIGNLSALTNLYLDNNQLTGNLPTEMGNLNNLNTLSIPYNQLTGNIPNSIGNLINLNTLYLNYNQLSGNIPANLGNLSNLQTLFLNNNQLSGSIPTSFSQLENLLNLHLAFNQLSGCFEETLSVLCSQLQFTEITNGNFFDAGWADFCQSELGICAAQILSDVWPGDVNFDGSVNGADIMHLGNYLYQSQNVNANSNPGIDWETYKRPNWGTNQHAGYCYYGYEDLKHADCDGNGTIDLLDVEAIVQNWGHTHSDAPAILPPIPCFYFDDFSDYELTLQPVGRLETNIISFNIALTHQQEPIKIRSGFLNVNYYNPNGSNMMGTALSLNDSWLGTPDQDLYYYDKFNSAENSLTAGFTKTNLNNSIGQGVIGRVYFLLDDFDASNTDNIADIAIEFGFQNSDTTSVFLRETFLLNLGGNTCENTLVVNQQLPLQNVSAANNTLLTEGALTINNQQQVSYKAADRVTLNTGFSVKAGATFKVYNDACD